MRLGWGRQGKGREGKGRLVGCDADLHILGVMWREGRSAGIVLGRST